MGRLLAEQDIGIVFGGGKVGLMGKIADAALQAGGRVIGVMPRFLVDCEIAHQGLIQLHVVKNLHQRKALITGIADGFLALPGGPGTFDEFFEAWTWGHTVCIKNRLGY